MLRISWSPLSIIIWRLYDFTTKYSEPSSYLPIIGHVWCMCYASLISQLGPRTIFFSNFLWEFRTTADSTIALKTTNRARRLGWAMASIICAIKVFFSCALEVSMFVGEGTLIGSERLLEVMISFASGISVLAGIRVFAVVLDHDAASLKIESIDCSALKGWPWVPELPSSTSYQFW